MSVLSLPNTTQFTNPIEFHPEAEEKLEIHIENFKEVLKLQTQIVAHQAGDEQILTRHLTMALAILEKREHQQDALQEGAQIIGAALLGMSSSYLPIEPPTIWIMPYLMACIGCSGIWLIVWGIYRKRNWK